MDRTPDEQRLDMLFAATRTKRSKFLSARADYQRTRQQGADPRDLERMINNYFSLAKSALQAEEAYIRFRHKMECE